MKPYVAITGFTSPEQVTALEIPRIEGRDVMLGVLVSGRSLRAFADGVEFANARYPSIADAFAIVKAIKALGREDVKAAYHYNNKELVDVPFDLNLLARSPDFDALQLNLGSRDLVKMAILAMQRESGNFAVGIYDRVNIIFQANGAIAGDAPFGELFSFFDALCPLANKAHVLFDGSCGRGIEINHAAAEAAQAAAARFPDLVFGVAGGLTPETVWDVLKKYPTASVDVETGVRDEESLSVELANRYLREASAALERKEK